jgi:ABC-type ATPase with predicted acetyltransferase domain
MTIYAINQKFRTAPPGADGPSPGEAVLALAEMFGIGLDETHEVTLYEDLRLDVRPGDVVFVTGPSGSGKSVLVRRLAEAVRRAEPNARMADLGEVIPPAEATAIAGLGLPLGEALRLVSTAGLADAFLLLRRPAELSDGQRWRLRLAHALARLSGAPSAADHVLVADELASTLDRLCARAVAYRLRRLADERGLTVLAASAHDDLLEDLAPDVLVVKEVGSRAAVHYADPARDAEAKG